MTDRRALLRALLRQDLPSFTAKCFATLEAGRPFRDNWHIQHIGWQLGRVASGEVRRLAITIPPRHLKSICVTVAYTAWAMGHDPSLRVITVSYGEELAKQHAAAFRTIVESEWYRALFPAFQISRATQAEIRTTQHGYRYSSSVGGSILEVADGKPNDPPPLNQGRVMHARVRNDLHKMTVPFSDRSAGFIWFFSFLVLFSQVAKEHGDVVILLDEPGLNLHATAQADLLRYIREKLLPQHQVIYTTHSPFMVPTDDLGAIRTVEDVVRTDARGRPDSVGTVVGDDVLSTDRETLFPLQGALGYGITQSLFVGEHTLLVEGPAEILYFQALTAELEARGRKGLDRRWTPCPSNGVDKVQAFLSLFGGSRLHCAVLVDLAKGQKGKVEALRKLEGTLLQAGHVFTVADFTGADEADVEDLFEPDLLAAILNGTYGLEGGKALTGATLLAADPSPRLVKKAERAINAALPPSAGEMSHYAPARWLIQHPEALRGDGGDVMNTLDRFEAMFAAFNRLLP